ncbi:MAG: hypothetical protein JWO41_517 [Candidatus Saccharibacteria bacterium]|nr:hypothetical protein [Candidatus Saccharibacteria bacterium]
MRKEESYVGWIVVLVIACLCLYSSVSTANKEKTEAQDEVSSLQGDVSNLKNTIDEANSNIEDANRQIEDAQSYADSDYDSMTSALADLQTVDTVSY